MKTRLQQKHVQNKFGYTLKLLSLTAILLMMSSVFNGVYAQKKPGGATSKPEPLKVYENIKLGWGKGRANNPGYISIKNGILSTYNNIKPSDRETQEMVDVVFPGDWGSSGGKFTIASPSSVTAGADTEYTKNWQRRRGTQLSLIRGMDIAGFEKMKTVPQLRAFIKSKNLSYDDWFYMPDEGTAFVIKTEDGDIALAFIHAINGTYGAQGANVVISFKTIER